MKKDFCDVCENEVEVESYPKIVIRRYPFNFTISLRITAQNDEKDDLSFDLCKACVETFIQQLLGKFREEKNETLARRAL